MEMLDTEQLTDSGSWKSRKTKIVKASLVVGGTILVAMLVVLVVVLTRKDHDKSQQQGTVLKQSDHSVNTVATPTSGSGDSNKTDKDEQQSTGKKDGRETQADSTTPNRYINEVIKTKMNLLVDPCSDFYRYACGGWIDATSIPANESEVSMFSVAQDKINQMLRVELENDSNEFRGHNSTAVSKWKSAYHSCMNSEAQKENGAKTLATLINQLGSWTMIGSSPQLIPWDEKTWSLQKAIEDSHNVGGDAFFKSSVVVDEKNTSRHIINFHVPYSSEIIRNRKYASPHEVAELLGGNEFKTNLTMKEVNYFEQHLRDRFLIFFGFKEPNKKMKLKQFQTIIGPWIDLKSYIAATFNGLIISDDEDILVPTSYDFSRMSYMIQETDRETLANYIVWTAIRRFTNYLKGDSGIDTLRLPSLQNVDRKQLPKWKRCLGFADTLLGFASSAIYVDATFEAWDKAIFSETFRKIRNIFLTSLNVVDWIDDTTRSRMRTKANAMDYLAGYPDWILDSHKLDKYYEKLDIKKDNLFANAVAFAKFARVLNTVRYDTTPDRRKWLFRPSVVNSYYTPFFNTITMPAGIFQVPFYSPNYSKPLFYSGIGFVLGHEFSHAFGSLGMNFDSRGNRLSMFTLFAEVLYNQRVSSCLTDQYNTYSIDGVFLNGRNTLNENIADNLGIRLAYKAYRQDTRSFKLSSVPGLDLTDDQMFFLGYAQTMCAIDTPENRRLTLRYAGHSYPEFRVKGIYDNNPELWEAFGCRKNQRPVCPILP